MGNKQLKKVDKFEDIDKAVKEVRIETEEIEVLSRLSGCKYHNLLYI